MIMSTSLPPQADWIAVDWGTTHLRVYAVQASGTVLATQHSDQGMGRLTPDTFEPALINLIADWLSDDRVTPVLACGMVGAKQGWQEAPYQHCPCPPLQAQALLRVNTSDPRIQLTILPGCARMIRRM